jgi:hypothetical protein
MQINGAQVKQGELVTLSDGYTTYTGEVVRVSHKTREVWLRESVGAPIKKISFDDIVGY